MKIKSIILSQLIYTNNNQFNVIIAVAFNERAPANQTALLINPVPALHAAVTRINDPALVI